MFHSPFPNHIRFAAVHAKTLEHEWPHEDETASLSNRVVPSRRITFALGRIAARRALGELMVPPPPILSGRDRAPCWPDGFVGTITHAADWGLAAVDRRERTRSVGLDLAHVSELTDTKIADLVADARERDWIAGDPRRLLAIFSAKESVYKAVYPECRIYFGFHDVTAEWSESPLPGFRVRFLRHLTNLWPAKADLFVAVKWYGDFVLTSAWVSATDSVAIPN